MDTGEIVLVTPGSIISLTWFMEDIMTIVKQEASLNSRWWPLTTMEEEKSSQSEGKKLSSRPTRPHVKQKVEVKHLSVPFHTATYMTCTCNTHTHTCVHIHRAMIDLFSNSLMDKTLTASLANLLHHVTCVIIFIEKSWVWELLKINSRDSEVINLCDWGQKVSLPYVINSLASLPNSYLQHQPPHKER